MSDSIRILDHDIQYTRIPNDIYGNPRYYIGLTSIMQYIPDQESINSSIAYINKRRRYLSLYRGKKYWYGYTIQSYNLRDDLTREISLNLSK